jgi:hypothetical protein
MLPLRRLLKISPALALIALAIPSSAFGQATRTWVSGVGDDANPCSRTAPCKTFPGAMSKTAAGGEIDCLDPGGFGGVTINKSLTIKCQYTEGGVLVSGTNAIVVNAAATDKITLRGLDINGLAPANNSLTGVKVLGAASVHIIDSEIYGFKAGVAVVPNTGSPRVVVANSHIHNNGIGVFSGPAAAAVGNIITTVRNNVIADNTCGVVASSVGPDASTPDVASGECGSAAGLGFNKVTNVEIFHNGIHQNGEGVHARGASALAMVAYNEITGNSAFGMHKLDTATLRVYSPATNVIDDNANTDTPNSTVPQVKKHARKRGK